MPTAATTIALVATHDRGYFVAQALRLGCIFEYPVGKHVQQLLLPLHAKTR